MNVDQQARHALEVRGLCKSFGGVDAVADVDLDVPEGCIYGLLGPNGAGKTTLLNLVSGFLVPDHGSVVLAPDVHLEGSRPHQVARSGVARTYQNVRLFDGLTVLETVVSGFYLHRPAHLLQTLVPGLGRRRENKELEERARELLRRVGVTADPGLISTTLPYGEQRRVEIARALATQPRLLLLDEPTAGMNSVESGALGDLLTELQLSGITLMLIEHNMELVLRYCQGATVMNFGRVLASGPPEQCLADPDVRDAYFGKAANAKRV